MISLLYRALEAAIGIVVFSNDPERLRAALYKEMHSVDDPRLKRLTLSVRDSEHLFIYKRTKDEEGTDT